MTIQVTVRLPDDLVLNMDKHVSIGDAESRAAYVALALERQRRAEREEREIQILQDAQNDPDPELDAWINWRSRHPVPMPDLD